MVKTYSLPVGLVEWLDEEAVKGNRSASGELRDILEKEREKRWMSRGGDAEVSKVESPTGVAEDRSKSADRDWEKADLREMEPGLELPAAMLNHSLAESTHAMLKRGDIAGIAKKIASGIPGVGVAVDLEPKPVGDWPIAGMVIPAKSAKKSTEDTKGRVSLTKGFWREEYPDEAAAKIKAAEMGWKSDEFEIKPLK